MWCLKCDSWRESGKFCFICGERLVEEGMECPYCGEKISFAYKFCEECGRPVQEEVNKRKEELKKEVKK